MFVSVNCYPFAVTIGRPLSKYFWEIKFTRMHDQIATYMTSILIQIREKYCSNCYLKCTF